MDVEIFIPIIMFIALAVTIIFWRKYQNDERLAMIEKGMNPSDGHNPKSPSFALRFALLLIGAGVGLFIGYFLDALFNMEEVAYFSMLFIFGGLGLGLSYVIDERNKRD